MLSPSRRDAGSVADELLIDSICERYEAALRNGANLTPNDFLADVTETVPARLAEELHKVRAAHDSASGATTERTIGPYTLVRPLGAGGMGEVWVAHQDQPVRRDVAVKLIRSGLDSHAVLARFQQERQTLANLDHPNIARVLDAGTTPQGRPYYVMELIAGAPLTAACEAVPSDVPSRLRLFLDLCRAVQHAHQKGVIHRDLKPSNVLVSELDSRPVIKVIDFGVAKLLGDRTEDGTGLTQAGSIIGTWEYMAPEQAGGASNDIDTRADIYSLGVILYELLTGQRPFDSRRWRDVPLDEAIRILREEDPPRPSVRTASRTPGELDWIVMKCLEKDRRRRYDSAASLARDIERYLAHEPIEARPPSVGYRVGKFVRRNRAMAATSVVLLLAIVSGAVAAVWGYQRAKRSEAQAVSAAAETNFANDTLLDVFAEFDIRQVRHGSEPVEYVLAERLIAAGQRLTPETIRDPNVRARLQNRMGLTLLSLDRPREAIPLFEHARAVRAEQLGDDHPDTLEITSNLAEAYRESGQARLALPMFERLHERTIAHFGPEHPRTIVALSNLAAAHHANGQPRTALPLYEEVYNWRRTHLGEQDPDTFKSLNNLAASHIATGQPAKAVPLHERALDMRTQALGPDHADTLLSVNNLASTYLAAGRTDDALGLLEPALPRHQAKFGPDHRQTLVCMGNLAGAYRGKKRMPDAIALYDQVLRLQRVRLGSSHPDTMLGMNNLAAAYLGAKSFDKAIPLFEEVLNLQTTKLGGVHPDTLLTVNNLALAYHELGAVEKAIPMYERTLAAQRAKNGSHHPETTGTMSNLAIAYAEIGRGAAAATLFTEYVGYLKQRSKPDDLSTATMLTHIGNYLILADQYAAAEPHLREGLAVREKHAANSWWTAYCRSLLGRSLQGQLRLADAEPLLLAGYEGLRSRQKSIPARNANSLRTAGEWLAELYSVTNRPDLAQSVRQSLPLEVAPAPRLSK